MAWSSGDRIYYEVDVNPRGLAKASLNCISTKMNRPYVTKFCWLKHVTIVLNLETNLAPVVRLSSGQHL